MFSVHLINKTALSHIFIDFRLTIYLRITTSWLVLSLSIKIMGGMLIANE